MVPAGRLSRKERLFFHRGVVFVGSGNSTDRAGLGGFGFFGMAGFADHLSHGTHGAVYAPRAGFEKQHGNQTQNRRGQHNSIESKGKLSNPWRGNRRMVGPTPRQTDGPKQGDGFAEVIGACKDQIGHIQHVEKHDHKEGQKAITEPFGTHPGWNRAIPGKMEFFAQQAEELAPAAEPVAVCFISPDHGDEQRSQKADHSQPGK